MCQSDRTTVDPASKQAWCQRLSGTTQANIVARMRSALLSLLLGSPAHRGEPAKNPDSPVGQPAPAAPAKSKRSSPAREDSSRGARMSMRFAGVTTRAARDPKLAGEVSVRFVIAKDGWSVWQSSRRALWRTKRRRSASSTRTARSSSPSQRVASLPSLSDAVFSLIRRSGEVSAVVDAACSLASCV